METLREVCTSQMRHIIQMNKHQFISLYYETK